MCDAKMKTVFLPHTIRAWCTNAVRYKHYPNEDFPNNLGLGANGGDEGKIHANHDTILHTIRPMTMPGHNTNCSIPNNKDIPTNHMNYTASPTTKG